jgi:hypothetical protein
MRRVLVSTLAAVALLAVFAQGNTGITATGHQLNPAIKAGLSKPQRLPNGALVPQVSGGVMTSFLEARAALRGKASSASVPNIQPNSNGCANTFVGGGGSPDNIRANQDCSLRRNAEEEVQVNPTDPSNIVVTQNDSRVGFNQTGLDFSVDGGVNWGDYSIPTRFLNCQGYGFDAFSDPAHAFDADGNLYYITLGFDVSDGATGLFVWKSNADHKGSFLHAPSGNELSSNPQSIIENCSLTIGGQHGTDQQLSLDKELMAIDTYAGSPGLGNIYMTFTSFDFSCGTGSDQYCASDIAFTRSTNGGTHWSKPILIDGNNPAICKFGDAFDSSRSPNDCDFDQGSAPVVGPDGSINVAFNNCNTNAKAANGLPANCQQLFVKSTDQGAHWSQPVKVAVDQSTEPINFPPNAQMSGAGCPVGRQCLYPNGYRMNNFPSMGVQDSTGKLAVFWSDFRHGGPCDTSPGWNTEPCANHNEDVFTSVSTDGGATWGVTKLVTRVTGARSSPTDPNAQWQAWGDVAENGDLTVAYYDRKYSDCETSGCNDITLARSRNNGGAWTYQRISTGSMPNLTPANNAVQAGFLGDYMWTQAFGTDVHMAWGDTRGTVGSANPTPEEDVYYATVPVRRPAL